MTKLESINKSLKRLNTPKFTFTVKLENGIYCLYNNDKYILCGRESIIDDLIHGFIMGFVNGMICLYKEL